MEEELNRYLIVYAYNHSSQISLDFEIIKEKSLLDAASYWFQWNSRLNDCERKIDYEKEIMIIKDEERIPIFDEKYSEMFEKVYFDYCYIANIDNIDTFSEVADLVYLNHKHGILDTKDYRCFD